MTRHVVSAVGWLLAASYAPAILPGELHALQSSLLLLPTLRLYIVFIQHEQSLFPLRFLSLFYLPSSLSLSPNTEQHLSPLPLFSPPDETPT